MCISRQRPGPGRTPAGARHEFGLRVRPESRRGSLAGLLLHLVGHDDVPDLEVVVPDTDTALEALTDLGGIVLEPAQGIHREVLGGDHALADEPGLAVTPDQAAANDRTGDVTDPGHLEDLTDLGATELDLLVNGLEETLHRCLDLVDGLVDDRVVPNVDTHAIGQLTVLALGANVEADDDRLGGRRQVDVVLRDRTDTTTDDPDTDLVATHVDLEQRLLERLDRTGGVPLDEEEQFGALTLLEVILPGVEGDPTGRLRLERETLTRLSLLGDLPRHPVVLDAQEGLTGTGHVGQTQHLPRAGRLGRFHVLAVLVEHGTHTAVRVATHDRITDAESSALDQDGGHGTTATVQVGLDGQSLGVHLRVRLEVELGVGGQDDRLQQGVDVLTLEGGD